MTGDEVGAAVQLACLLEASAPKPGNVAPGRPFRDMSYEDFLASAAAIGPAFTRAGEHGLGVTILEAVEATRGWTRANTNLGIILLAAPIARAAARGGPLQEGVRRELESTTVEDAVLAYDAIRLASPGGLGSAPEADVRDHPSVTLRHAMRLSAHRDSIAQEWASGFEITFGCGAPALRAALASGLGWSDATVETYLHLLAHVGDTLIARKLGPAAAREVSEEASRILACGGVRTPEGRARLEAFDRALRDPGNRRNPGTTADLTAAALLVVILEREAPFGCGEDSPTRPTGR
ncbi:MAG TPA: triphosphoribosyl-dephospho-CoA synthase [Gemmatimonadales bacterium]|nr:triphosphoribosyl-dephospho-CoA synthase [Gemmatimonadales bacterium]